MTQEECFEKINNLVNASIVHPEKRVDLENDIKETLNAFEAPLSESISNLRSIIRKMNDEPVEYVRSYSLTPKEVDKKNTWEVEHNKKYHKKGFGYQGAISTSNFEVVFGDTSIGSYSEDRCVKCYEEYLKKKKETEAKRIEFRDNSDESKESTLAKELKALDKEQDRLYNKATFEIRGIDE